MKVGMLVRDMRFGYGSHVLGLSRGLSDLGVDFTVVEGHGDISTAYRKMEGYDVVHVQGSPFRPLRDGGHLVVTVHTLLRTERKLGQGGLRSMLGVKMEEMTLKNADALILVNERLRHELASYPGWRGARYVIPNGVDVEEFEGEAEREGFALWVGRDIPRKRLMDFLGAASGSGVRVCVADGRMERQALVRAYRRAAFYVCTSAYETGPITLLEAWAARCPTIITSAVAKNFASPPSVVYETGNTAELRDAMLEVGSMSPEERRRMTDEGYAYARAHHDWRKIAAETLKVYEAVA